MTFLGFFHFSLFCEVSAFSVVRNIEEMRLDSWAYFFINNMYFFLRRSIVIDVYASSTFWKKASVFFQGELKLNPI